MPQMFPMNWLLLFMFIITMFLFFLNKLFFYHSFNTGGPSIYPSALSLESKWKW